MVARARWGGILGGGILAMAVMALAAGRAAADEVPLDIRDKVEASLNPHFVRPQTSLWRWDGMKPFLHPDSVVCGAVNFQSAGQRYIGFHRFYAIIHEGAVSLAQMENPADDTTGALEAKLKLLCGG